MRQQTSSAARKNQQGGLKLSKRLTSTWSSCVLKRARLRNMSMASSDDDKMRALLTQEFRNIERLWEVFTQERDDLTRYLGNPKKQLVSYLLGFHLPNVARTSQIVDRWSYRIPVGFWRSLVDWDVSLTDIGCGTGALSSAFVDFMAKKKCEPKSLSVSLLDKQKAFLDVAQELLDSLKPNKATRIHTHKGDLDLLLAKGQQTASINSECTLHIDLLGYVWNELSKHKKAQRQLLKRLEALQSQHSIIVILEPANQNLSRACMELREELLAMGYLVNYPCATSFACPMLDRAKDWCYSEVSWERPKIIERLDKKLGVDHRKLSTTAMVFVSPKAAETFRMKASEKATVVGRPLDRKPSTKKVRSPNRAFSYLLCDGKKLEKKPSKELPPAKSPAATKLRGEQVNLKKSDR